MNKYTGLVPDWTGFSIDLVCNGRTGAEMDQYREWSKEYCRLIREQPRQFWKWYKEQLVFAAVGKLWFPIPFPHEVFPELMGAGFKDFYKLGRGGGR